MRKIWNFDIKLKIGVGFAIILFVLVTVQYALNKSISNVISSQEEIIKSTKLSTEIESIKSSVCFFESKMKGYVLTGNDTLLENNEKYLSSIVSKFADLKSLSPNKEQIASIDTLVSLLNAEIQFCDEVIFQYDISRENALSLIQSGKGQMLMDQIIKEFGKIHTIETGKFAEIILRNYRYSEQVRFMDASAYVIAFLLILLCVGVLYRDINKREKLEQKLIIAQKNAEEAASIKQQFMANMSHEIRTPMNAIIGFNDRLSKTTLDETQKEYVSAVKSSGENLLTIVNDILDFSKIEAGMVRIEKINFDLYELLDSLSSMFFVQAKEKNINLRLQILNTVPKFIVGDPTRLTQILINLIGNALKFTHTGNIDILVDQKQSDEEGVLLQFKVKDTGIGISEELIPVIFERFTQAKSDTSRIYGGTGLGLSIAKKLVELQSGTITVNSRKNNGSEFTFIIPYKKSDNPKNDLKNDDDKNTPFTFSNDTKVLVVEDNLMNQRLARFMLGDWGLQFDICSNGKLAIEKIKENNAYTLILMDIQMPEMNGYEATKFIREELKLQLPIIAMTADVLPGEKEKCIRLGMTDYITKPIKDIDLRNMMIKHLQTNSTK